MSGPDRSAEQVFASARAIDRARAAGVSDDLLGAWLQARRAWWGGAIWPDAQKLIEIIDNPHTAGMDEMLTAAIKRRLRSDR